MKLNNIKIKILLFIFVLGCSSTDYINISNYTDNDQIRLAVFTDILIVYSNSTVPIFLEINNSGYKDPPSFYFDYLKQSYNYVYPRSEMEIVKYEWENEKLNPNLKKFIHKKSKKQGVLISLHKPKFSSKTEATVTVSTQCPPSNFRGEIYYLTKVGNKWKIVKSEVEWID